ncbi:MAG: glycosyltransferase, partial [Sulfurimonadaceae bacterium]|nr:glycosyltransferase [Sulfurimonadaceae bacterium]
VASMQWHLTVSTLDLAYAKEMISQYPHIEDRIDVVRAESLEELRDQVNGCDVGLALHPRAPLFDTAIPAKVMDYYTCAIPAVVTENPKNRALFDDGEAIYSGFELEEIADTLANVIAMPREQIAEIGSAGQKKILGMKRNYEIMARELADVLEGL